MNTAEAASAAGMTPGVFRAHMARLRASGNDFRLPPEQWIDKRTPSYDNEKVTAWIANRAQ